MPPQYAKQAQEKADDKKMSEAARRELGKWSPDAVGKSRKRTYIVQSGDSLSKIAGVLLGDVMRWPEIHEANKDQIENPDLIYPGQELIIPNK